MARVRVLVGTKKGAFVITSDGARHGWKIDGPYFGGWEVVKSRVVCKSERKLLDASVRLPWRPPSVREA